MVRPQRGECVIRAGEHGECMYFLSDGAVQVRDRQNVFSYYKMCSLTIECVLLLSDGAVQVLLGGREIDRMCSLTIECVLLL